MNRNTEAFRASFDGGIRPDNVCTKGRFILEIYNGEQTKERVDILRERVAIVYYQGFGLGIMQTADEVRESLIKKGSVFFVKLDNKDIAFSIQHTMRVTIPDDRGSEKLARVLYTSSRLVLPDYQGKGIGKWTMQVEDDECKPDYFAGRSQNPAIHLGWESLSFTGEDRPIHKDYRGEDLKSRQFRTVLWALVRTSKIPVDINTGLSEGVYKEGETKGYIPDLSHERYAEINKRMLDLGLVRERGDTLYYVIERVESGKDNIE